MSLVTILQKLLLLPELSGNSITGIDSDPVGRLHFPTVISNLELVTDNGYESLPNGGAPGIKVDSLTASWTHVRK